MKVSFIFALLFVYVFSQVNPVCTTNNDCNHYSTFAALTCENPGNLTATCVSREKVAFGTTVTNSKGMCTDSLNFGSQGLNILTCGQYASAGCTPENLIFTRCVGSTYNTTTRKCQVEPTPAFVEVNEGERCSILTTPMSICKQNLQCIDSVCRRRLKLGENCFNSGINCGAGLHCDGDLCVVKHSRVAQERCKTDDACVDELCSNGVCAEKRSVICYSNTQCPQSICYKEAGRISGFCTRGKYLAHSRLDNCLANKCNAPMTFAEYEKCVTDNCMSFVVEEKCQERCNEREDLRLENDGFIYDCKALTRSKIADNTCNVRSTIRNCNVPISSSVVQGLSFVALALLALIFA